MYFVSHLILYYIPQAQQAVAKRHTLAYTATNEKQNNKK